MMSESVVDQVREKYAVAASGLSSDHAGVQAVAEAFGYTPEELAALPAEANMGLSCGNPTATANLRPGEVVVDLGCGGGIDVLLAAKKVGPTGKAIGIDMTPEMIDRATRNAIKAGVTNVEFHLARIEAMPLPTTRPTWSSRTASSTSPRTSRRSSARCSACSSRAAGSRSPTSP